MSNPKVMAYRRENGRVGIRNHVIILPLDDLSNSACEKVAFNTKGCKALPHAYGRLQFGEDLQLFFRTLIGTGANPNVAAVVVIGIEPEWTNIIVDGIAETGKPVTGFSIERHGEIKTVETASWKAKEYMHWASELKREECDLSEIWVSTKCGESDTTSGLASNPTVGNAFDKLVAMGATCSFGETSEITGAEMVCKERAATPEVAEQFMWRICWGAENDDSYTSRFTRSGKVFSDKVGLKTIELALDVLGGMGIMRDSPSEKIVRDILTFLHGDGTDSACLLEAANTLETPA